MLMSRWACTTNETEYISMKDYLLIYKTSNLMYFFKITNCTCLLSPSMQLVYMILLLNHYVQFAHLYFSIAYYPVEQKI